MNSKPPSKRLILENGEPSLLFAINELLQSGGIDFDEWWDEFKKPPTNKIDRENWTQPKFIDVTPKADKPIGRWIKYFPDKEDEGTNYLLCGTGKDLVNHIVAISYQQSSGSAGISGKNSKPPLAGFPLIELRFASDDRKFGQKWIRCAGYTDDEKIANAKLAKFVTPADIKGWTNKIKTVFGDTQYMWRKGKECVSYSGQIARLQGLEGYAYVRERKDGIDLFTSLLKIFNATPDKDGFNRGESMSDTKYAKQTKEITVIGKKVVPEEKRPIADCKFDYARLWLPLLNKPVLLVKRNVILYK